MKTLDYSLPQSVGGGKLLSFTYSRSLNDLMGTWSAEVSGGSFTSGNAFSVSGMTGGYISFAMQDNVGRWHLSGYDAGVSLMRSTPYTGDLANGGAGAVIRDLANYCGMTVSVGEGLTGFNAKSIVSGTSCAEAILELCLLSGYIAHISNNGTLICSTPSGALPSLTTIFSDGTSLDLGDYATHVTTVVTRRKETLRQSSGGGKTYYIGSTPGGTTSTQMKSGTFSYTDQDGTSVSGSWSITMILPINVMQESVRTITRGNLTITHHEYHAYDIKTKTVWRGDMEYRLWAFAETDYSITKTTTGFYEGKNGPANFAESTEEVMARDFDIFDAPFVEPDWEGNLDLVSKESYTRSTTRTGGMQLESDMPPYSPPHDSYRTRQYKRTDFGLGVLCIETESIYENRSIGKISAIDANGIPVKYMNHYVGIGTMEAAKWVEVITYRTMYEKYKNNGECEVSSSTEWSDNGSKWLFDNHYYETGDATMDKYQESYAKFSSLVNATEVSFGGSGLSSSVWQYMEMEGRQRVYKENEDSVPTNSENWYQNGGYVPAKICPHYEAGGYKCSISGINAVGNFAGEKCPYRGRGWQSCIRARAALEEARTNEDQPLIEAPVVGMASTSASPPCSYQRDFYIDDIISTAQAQTIANQAAQNILTVKGTKGLRRGIVIPLDITIEPNGVITSVSHDWKAMQTTLSYKISGTVPSFMIPSSAAGIADGVSGRNAGRSTRPRVGTVTSVDGTTGDVYVTVGSVTYICTTRLINIGVGDSVLLTMVSGNSMRGHITDRI
jgi:hypothetical protein